MFIEDNMKIMKKTFILSVFFLAFFAFQSSFAQSIKERLKGKETLVYKVYFNAVPVGKIEWNYLGRKVIEGRAVDALSLNSDTQIMNLLSLTSKERVFLDSKTGLPFKVERDVVFFGKEELIKEAYDQVKGCVKISNTSNKEKDEIICPGKPIRNILELLYFFPEDIELKKGEWMNFNLPTQKIRMRFVKERLLKFGQNKEETYFLQGNGSKKFNLWLDKEKRLPLRLEFITMVGKITILRQN